MTFSSTAPAHPHATRVALYPVLFFIVPLAIWYKHLASNNMLSFIEHFHSRKRDSTPCRASPSVHPPLRPCIRNNSYRCFCLFLWDFKLCMNDYRCSVLPLPYRPRPMAFVKLVHTEKLIFVPHLHNHDTFQSWTRDSTPCRVGPSFCRSLRLSVTIGE